MKGRHRVEVGCKERWESRGQEGRRQEGESGRYMKRCHES